MENSVGLRLCSVLSENISAVRSCPCNYFGEHIWFNKSLANEPRQDMLQASSL